MPAYVYLLAHQSAPRFKIGKAVDVGARVRQLGRSRFDFSQSRALRVSDDAAAMNLERLLHRAFAKSRLPAEDVIGMPGESTDGDSEWFSADCKSRLDDFLEVNRDLLDFEPVSAKDFRNMLPSAHKPVVQPSQPKASVRAARKPEHPELAIEAAVETFLEKLSALAACASDVYFRTPKTEGSYGTLLGTLSLDEVSDPEAVFDDLMSCSVRTGKWGAFRMVSGVTFGRDGRKVEFEVDVLWKSQREGFSDHSKAAAQIAAHPLAVPGWDAPRQLLLAA